MQLGRRQVKLSQRVEPASEVLKAVHDRAESIPLPCEKKNKPKPKPRSSASKCQVSRGKPSRQLVMPTIRDEKCANLPGCNTGLE